MHQHKYYTFDTKYVFEPRERTVDGIQLYERVEYAYMMCACTKVIKVKVEEN